MLIHFLQGRGKRRLNTRPKYKTATLCNYPTLVRKKVDVLKRIELGWNLPVARFQGGASVLCRVRLEQDVSCRVGLPRANIWQVERVVALDGSVAVFNCFEVTYLGWAWKRGPRSPSIRPSAVRHLDGIVIFCNSNRRFFKTYCDGASCASLLFIHRGKLT